MFYSLVNGPDSLLGGQPSDLGVFRRPWKDEDLAEARPRHGKSAIIDRYQEGLSAVPKNLNPGAWDESKL